MAKSIPVSEENAYENLPKENQRECESNALLKATFLALPDSNQWSQTQHGTSLGR